MVGDFTTVLSLIGRSSKQNLNRGILDLSNVINQVYLTDIYRKFHPNKKVYGFFCTPYGTFSNVYRTHS